MKYIWIVLVGLLVGACQPPSPEQSSLLIETSAWKLGDASSNAVILWQRAEPREKPTSYSEARNGGLIATEQEVTYLSAVGADQPYPRLLGLDLHSGHENWRFLGEVFEYPRNMLSGFDYMRSVGNGYVFTSYDAVTKIDKTGQFVWRQDMFPSHTIGQIFYESGENLYLPSLSTIYQLDIARGEIQAKTPIKNLIGFFGDRAAVLEQVDPDASMEQSGSPIASLKILDRQTNQVLSTFPYEQFTNTDLVLSAIMNEPILELDQNVLVTYDSSIVVQLTRAYNIVSGQHLWTLDRHMYGLPIILNHQLVIFADYALEIYDLESGQLNQRIPMERYENGILDTSLRPKVWLAGYGDIIVVNFRATREIVAVQLKP